MPIHKVRQLHEIASEILEDIQGIQEMRRGNQLEDGRHIEAQPAKD